MGAAGAGSPPGPEPRGTGWVVWVPGPASIPSQRWTRGNLVINLAEHPVGKVKCRVSAPRGLQPCCSSHGCLSTCLCGERGLNPIPLPPTFPPHSFLSRATGMKKPKALPVLDRAFGRDLHPNPVGDPPKRLLGGKSPEPYSGTYGG